MTKVPGYESKTVALVAQDDSMRETVASLLELTGIGVISARDSQSLDARTDIVEQADILITDVASPIWYAAREKGVPCDAEFVLSMKGGRHLDFPRNRIVFLVTEESTANLVVAQGSHALTMPFRLADLCMKINEVLGV